MTLKRLEIVCAFCKADTLLVREPRYEGFKKTGETLKCATCAHVYATEAEVPFKEVHAPKVFDSTDAARKVDVFREAEKGRICCYCRNYIVNPFTQKCGLFLKVVEATDSCGDFKSREPVGPKVSGSVLLSGEIQNTLNSGTHERTGIH